MIAFLFFVSLALAGSSRSSKIDDLKWLAGCWEMKNGDRLTEEHWMSPRGGVMIGMSRTVRGESLIELEQVRIESRGTDLYYVAFPLRQATAEFKASIANAQEVRFENPSHDFPTKISYRREGADSLMAAIEGQRSGATRRIEYPYTRVSCDRPESS